MRLVALILVGLSAFGCATNAPSGPAFVGPSTTSGPARKSAFGAASATSPKLSPQKPFDSWKSSAREKWAKSLDGYVPAVKPGNQTVLKEATAKAWANYLASMHVRLHAVFSDQFVAALRSLPPESPLSDRKLVARVEIVIRPDGSLDRLGLVKSSGVLEFDIGVLDSIDRAAPFASPPPETRSADELSYLQWELFRDDIQCSNINAYPYVLTGP